MSFSVSTVSVPDQRLGDLKEAIRPKKCVPLSVEVFDFPALTGSGRASQALAAARETDCLACVLRDFDDAAYPHPAGEADPVRDLEAFRTELLMADLEQVEKRLVKLRVSVTKPTSTQEEERRELALLEGFQERIDGGGDLRGVDLHSEEMRVVRGFRFLSQKPLLPVLNVAEEKASAPAPEGFFSLCAKIEEELLELGEDERAEFMADLGIHGLSGPGLIGGAARAMDLVTFYTTASDELRAWAVVRGTPAPGAAGKIHSDMERGFIRAEVVSWKEVLASSGKAKPRLEGKKYEVQDGDVITFRFSV
jgi:ribosome-binding ATPase YchF (GTP1/OBG family)